MSLIESCLSIAVISTVAMIAVPMWSNARENYVLEATARDVSTAMRAARMQAIVRNRPCRLRVTTPVSYAIECEMPIWAATESVTVGRDITVSANAHPRFHPTGNVAPAATVTVRNASGRTRRIIVNVAGRVRIQ